MLCDLHPLEAKQPSLWTSGAESHSAFWAELVSERLYARYIIFSN